MVDYSQYFGEIDRLIDEKGCVTYRGMACGLNISVTASKCALFEYLEKSDKPLKSTVLEVGRNGSALLAFKFVTVDDFSGVKKLLGNAKDKHVYALHCADSSEHPNLAMQGNDLNQVEEATRGSSTLIAFSTNSVGLVHMTNIDSNVKKTRAVPLTTPKSNPVTKTPSTVQASKPVTAAASSATEAKAKLASKANAFFGSTVKSNEKKKNSVKKTEPEKAKTKPQSDSIPVVETAKKKTIVEEDWDDENSDDEAAGENAPNKEKLKLRAVSACAPKGSGGVHQADVILTDKEVDESASDDDDEEGKRKKTKKEKAEPTEKVVFKRYGAMDGFMEDAALKARSDQQSGGADGPPQKVKRKKLVEKMFADEKGYLVTEMVMEEVSDDEADEAASQSLKRQQSHPKPAPAPAKKAKSAPAKKGGATKSTGQQKSMMSFFSKK